MDGQTGFPGPRTVIKNDRVQLRGSLGGPARHLIAHEMNVLLAIIDNVELLARRSNLLLEALNFEADRIRRGRGQVLVFLVVRAGHGEHMQLFFALRADLAEAIDGLLVLIDRRQEQRVVLLAGEEFVDDFLHVAVAGTGPDLLEGLLQMSIFVHFLLHFLHEELAVKLLNHIVLHETLLVLIVVVLLGRLSNLHLPLVTILSLLERVVFVLDGFLQRHYTGLSSCLLVVDVVHEVVEASFTLQLALHGLPMLLRLFLVDLQFAVQRFGQRIRLQHESNPVLFHARQHVLVLRLMVLLKIVLLGHLCEITQCLLHNVLVVTGAHFGRALLFHALLDLLLDELEVFLALLSLQMPAVVTLSQLPESHRDFFLFFIARLLQNKLKVRKHVRIVKHDVTYPARNEVVRFEQRARLNVHAALVEAILSHHDLAVHRLAICLLQGIFN